MILRLLYRLGIPLAIAGACYMGAFMLSALGDCLDDTTCMARKDYLPVVTFWAVLALSLALVIVDDQIKKR